MLVVKLVPSKVAHDSSCCLFCTVAPVRLLSCGLKPKHLNLEFLSGCPHLQVDDTRKTLSYAVDELMKDIAAEKEAWEVAHQQHQQRASSVGSPATPGMLSPPDSPMHISEGPSAAPAAEGSCSSSMQPVATANAAAAEWQDPVIGVFVVHNKLKPKKAELPAAITESTYFTGGDIEDQWVSMVTPLQDQITSSSSMPCAVWLWASGTWWLYG